MKDTKDMQVEHGTRRREFLTKSAKVAAVAPAVALLLSQTSMPAHAQTSGGGDVMLTRRPMDVIDE